MGRLLHMVHDSYSEFHTRRDKEGLIEEYYDYSSQDANEHEKSDVPTKGNPENFDNLKKNLPGANQAMESSKVIFDSYFKQNLTLFFQHMNKIYAHSRKLDRR